MAKRFRTPHLFIILVFAAIIVSVVDSFVYQVYNFPRHFSYDYGGRYFGMDEKLDVFITYFKTPLGMALNLTFVFLAIISAGLNVYMVYYEED